MLVSLLAAETVISDFHARTVSNNVIVEWSTQAESNLQKFKIERSTDLSTWTAVGTVLVQQTLYEEKKYSFTDKHIFKGEISSLYYRLGLVDLQGYTTYHDVIASTSGVSAIRHTWGSIKAMFR